MVTRLKTALCWTLIISFYLTAMISPGLQRSVLAATTSGTMPENSMDEPIEPATGLTFRLSEGAEQPEKRESGNTAPAENLSEAQVASVLNRLPADTTGPTLQEDFRFRTGSMPPPRTGQTINVKFPQPETGPGPDPGSGGPLSVVRFQPTGAVPLAPQLSVTFSQPMVAVTSQEAAAQNVPVKLSPQPAGKWRWIGTKTLLFDADVAGGRFPMATEFRATVPAGTRSANGGTLAAEKSWTFSTPPPSVQSKYPEGGPTRRDTVMFVSFDQQINPSAVLSTIKVTAPGGPIAVRLATEAEIAADATVASLVKQSQAGRWVAFRAVNAGGQTTDALPSNTGVTVTVGPRTPSAEGPLTSTKAESFAFKTYGPMRFLTKDCGYDERCTPFDSWRLQFTNPVDATAFQESMVKVEPAIANLKTTIYGDSIHIEGVKQGRRAYRVTVDGALKDTFGQSLGQPVSVTFNVGPAPPTLVGMGGPMVVLDPSGPARYSVYSTNQPSLKVSLFSVTPADWTTYLRYLRTINNYYDEKAEKVRNPPGRLIYAKNIRTANKPDEMVETGLDLAPALKNGLGNCILVVEATVKRDDYDTGTIVTWVQSTKIGLTAFADNDVLVGWATMLKDGAPLAGAEGSLNLNGPRPQRAHAESTVVPAYPVWNGHEFETGEPQNVVPAGQTGLTGADGLIGLALPEDLDADKARMLLVRKGDDVAFLPEHDNYYNNGTSWYHRQPSNSLVWYVFDDRNLYKPGEEVHLKGWIRVAGGGKLGDLGPVTDGSNEVNYTVRDARGNEFYKGTARLNALSGFDTSFKLPDNANLGNAYIQFTAAKDGVTSTYGSYTFNHTFQIQEFRRPEFEVTANTATEGPHFVGGSANVSVAASYFAGGGLPDADVNWRVTAKPGSFTPPNRSDFTFGKWIPWWRTDFGSGLTSSEVFTGKTDAAGVHRLHIDFERANPPRPYTVTAEASVTDVNRQAWSSSTSLLVHPADLYVGVRSPRTFVQQGEPLVVESIVTDLDGKAIAGRDIKLRAVLLDWTYKNGAWTQTEADAQECTVRSAAEVVKCEFRPKQGGTYTVTATIMDDRERRNQSELTLWVAGGKTPPKRSVEQETADLIPNKKDYAPGDVAEILVQSPFAPADGVVTLRRSGLVKTESFHMSGSSYTLRIPLEEAYLPNLYVQVDLNGAAPRMTDAGEVDNKLPKRPAFASGSLNLNISTASRKLTVTATPKDKALNPGGTTSVELLVQDANGAPLAGSEAAVVVVDESVLALSGYKLDDPMSIFYTQRGADVTNYNTRSSVQLSDPGTLVTGGSDTVGAGGGGRSKMTTMPRPRNGQGLYGIAPTVARGGLRDSAAEMAPPSPQASPAPGEPDTPIALRTNFNALAVFAASVPTDANGRATVTVKLPDNLTRYRVMAVAVDPIKRFGSAESSINARMPLMVRPSAPRFLNFGDKFELPVVVQNQTDQPMTVNIAVKATNANLTAGGGRRVTVPANDRVEVRFPTSTDKAGTARFQIAASSGANADAAEVSLPVWTPATTEAFATYGEIDNGNIYQPVEAPPNVFPQFGGLEVTTSSTQLQELTDAVIYLTSYPFECSEQLASRILALAAMRDVLTAFKSKDLPSEAEMKAAVTRDIKRLQGMQNNDGGFAFWKKGDESWPYLGIHVAHALQRAKEKGYDVPDEMFKKSQGYLRNIEGHYNKYYTKEMRWALTSYALYVRNRMGDNDAGKARRILAEATLEKLSFESVGWLLSVLSKDKNSTAQTASIREFLNNRVTETAATAHFAVSYSDGDYLLLNSNRRADGVILESLIGDQPQNDLIPKIVRGLLAHRKKGRWENTQENVFILLALDRYFNTYEKTTPEFVAKMWLGNQYAGENRFVGRSTDSYQTNIPMRLLAQTPGPQNLVIAKDGPGRLYYRIGMKYAPTSLDLKPADYGFTVERRYEAIDDPADVRREADGTWVIKAGAKVRVRLTMVAQARRYHVALVDPLPAGLEALNPALATTGSIPRDDDQTGVIEGGGSGLRMNWWWWRPVWYEHQNLRDERVEAFTSLLWEGVYKYSYVARATTPGQFIVPPPKAEEMYHPETFGRGATDHVRVE